MKQNMRVLVVLLVCASLAVLIFQGSQIWQGEVVGQTYQISLPASGGSTGSLSLGTVASPKFVFYSTISSSGSVYAGLSVKIIDVNTGEVLENIYTDYISCVGTKTVLSTSNSFFNGRTVKIQIVVSNNAYKPNYFVGYLEVTPIFDFVQVYKPQYYVLGRTVNVTLSTFKQDGLLTYAEFNNQQQVKPSQNGRVTFTFNSPTQVGDYVFTAWAFNPSNGEKITKTFTLTFKNTAVVVWEQTRQAYVHEPYETKITITDFHGNVVNPAVQPRVTAVNANMSLPVTVEYFNTGVYKVSAQPIAKGELKFTAEVQVPNLETATSTFTVDVLEAQASLQHNIPSRETVGRKQYLVDVYSPRGEYIPASVTVTFSRNGVDDIVVAERVRDGRYGLFYTFNETGTYMVTVSAQPSNAQVKPAEVTFTVEVSGGGLVSGSSGGSVDSGSGFDVVSAIKDNVWLVSVLGFVLAVAEFMRRRRR